jgi:hypothetical protein
MAVKRVKKKEGIMLGVKPAGYWASQWNAFISSFINIARPRFLQAAFFDLLTLIALFLVFGLSFSLINRVSAPVLPELLNIMALQQAGDSEAFSQAVVAIAPVLNKILWIFLVTLIVAFFLSIFFISAFYGRAWALARARKPGKSFIRKLFLVNLLWFLAWIIILLITVNIFITPIAAIIMLIEALLFFYSDSALRAVFDDSKNIRQNFSAFFRIAVRLHWFVFFIISGVILGVILMLILGVFINIKLLFALLAIIFALLFMGWQRNYVISIVNSMK